MYELFTEMRDSINSIENKEAIIQQEYKYKYEKEQALEDANVIKGTMKRAKVILSGSIDKAVTLKGIKATKGAKAAIEAAGG